MNKLLRTKWILGALLALGVVGTTAQAGSFDFYFDESQSVWDISPWWVAEGDVLIYESQNSTELSDALRFVKVTHGDQPNLYYTTEVHFYSRLGGTEAADIGFPTDLNLNSPYTTYELSDGTFTYIADNPYMPGGNGSPGEIMIYHGISDVPDGGFTVAFLGLALVGLLGMRRSTAV